LVGRLAVILEQPVNMFKVRLHHSGRITQSVKWTCSNDTRKQQTTATTRQLRIKTKERKSGRLMETSMNTKRPH